MMMMRLSKHLLMAVLASLLSGIVVGFAPSSLNVVGSRQHSSGTPLSTALYNSPQPFGIVVQAEIDPDRMGEFMSLIEHNAVKSRQEPGCLRFDVLRSDDSDNTFFFYEIYKNGEDAVEFHKAQAHYQKWADFKASGGTVSSTTFKMNGEFMT